MKHVLKRLVPRALIQRVLPRMLKRQASRLGIEMQIHADHIDVVKGTTVLRLSVNHAVYLPDIITAFEYMRARWYRFGCTGGA